MIDRHLTLAEVAEQFQFSPRWLRDFIRARDIPVLHTGKQIRFDALALRSLEEALRRCPSRSADEKTPAPSPLMGPSAYRTGRGSAFELALKLTSLPSPAKKPPRSKRNCSATHGTGNVVALDRSERR